MSYNSVGMYLFHLYLDVSVLRVGIISSMSFCPSKHWAQCLVCESHKSLKTFFFSVILSPTVFLFGQHLQFLGSSALSLTISNLPIFTSFPQLRPSLKTTVHHFNLSLDNLFNSLAPRSFPLTYLAKPQLWINLSTFSAPLFELLSTAIKKKNIPWSCW